MLVCAGSARSKAMKSKSVLGLVQVVAMAVIGMTQVHQAMPVLAGLAQRTAAPLEQMVLLGINPSYPRSPVPAVQPFAHTGSVQVCDRSNAVPAHIRQTVVRVEAPRPMIETIAAPVSGRVTLRRVHVTRIDSRAFDSAVQIEMNDVDFKAEIARAQHQIEKAMRDAQRQHTVVF